MDIAMLREELTRQLRERPYWTSAALIGMGWVVGRALPVRVLASVAALGARTALFSTLEGVVASQLRTAPETQETQS